MSYAGWGDSLGGDWADSWGPVSSSAVEEIPRGLDTSFQWSKYEAHRKANQSASTDAEWKRLAKENPVHAEGEISLPVPSIQGDATIEWVQPILTVAEFGARMPRIEGECGVVAPSEVGVSVPQLSGVCGVKQYIDPEDELLLLSDLLG